VSVALLELAAEHLGELLDEVTFVGGATVPLWITDPAAPPFRPTKDVDVIVEVTTSTEFHGFEERLRRRHFDEDQADGVICRKRHRESGLILDVMPSEPRILGFANRWQREALPHAAVVRLPSGAEIKAVSPPYLVATKLEAFRSRGKGDFLASRDFADVITLVDGREELVAEVVAAPTELRGYLTATLASAAREAGFQYGVLGALRPDAASQARAEAVVLPRLRAIVSSA
jgi:hypothetical protein